MKNGPPAVLVRGPARTYKSGRMRNRDRLKSMAASPASGSRESRLSTTAANPGYVGASLLAKSLMPTPSASPGLRSGWH